MLSSQGLAADINTLSFYRSQQSLFPSGQAPRKDLEKQILRRENDPWYRVVWNKKEYEISGDSVVKDIQLTQNLIPNQTLDALKSPRDGAAKAFTTDAKTALMVLRTEGAWAELVEPKSRQKGWVPLAQLSAPSEDKGIYITLIDSFLQRKAQGSAEILTTIPRKQRLHALGIEKNFLKVFYQNQIGYVEMSNLACRGDFAMWAYHQHKGWLGISHRENAYLISVDEQKLALQDFLAFAPYTERAVVTQKFDENGPSIRSRVDILTQRPHQWILSNLEGHGEVWWRGEDADPARFPASLGGTPLASQITSEQLLKRNVSAVSFAGGKSLKGLASADGIYRTDDGKTWNLISDFGDKNYPVNIHPDKIWYVGSFRSFDEGKTFEPYIKWDKLAEQIQNSIHKAPRHLRISQIEPLSHSRIRILVDTGVQKIKMQAHVLSNEWSLSK